MIDQRNPFAGTLAVTAAPAISEDPSERRIAFTSLDEQRILAVAFWCKLIGVLTLVSAGLTALLNLYGLWLQFSGFGAVRAVFSFLVSLGLGKFLLSAARPLRLLAATDESDKANLLEGCQALTRYFNLLGVLLIFGAAVLLVGTAQVLLLLAHR